MQTKTLSNGVQIPVIGLGVFQTPPKDTVNAVNWALDCGYRHIDTAAAYGNEKEVAEGISRSGFDREDVFITTKLWNDDMRAGLVREAIATSLKNLGTDYIDLYLIHWPVAGKFVDSWKVMEEYYNKGVFKAIGVSNFHERHLDELIRASEIMPMVNQIELHPFLTQENLVRYNTELGIATECWGPLARGKVMGDETLARLAHKYGKTIPEIVLRWEFQRGLITIPKSAHKERIIDNIRIFNFILSDADMASISALNRNERAEPRWNPDTFNF
jgi:Aldo/keto reductases, related to diketogulonate reductase